MPCVNWTPTWFRSKSWSLVGSMRIGRLKTIPTVFSLPVAERRRLLLSSDRLEQGGSVLLNSEEQHYLRRVLRLRCGEQVDLIDGCGRLTTATLMEAKLLELDRPAQLIEPQAQPQLGPSRGLDAAGDG